MSKFIPNSFQITNDFVDDLMGDLSGNAVKCYVFIVRKTRGWQKDSDCISISQFSEKLKIKDERTIRKFLNELIEYGLIGKREIHGRPSEYFLTEPPAKNAGTPPAKNAGTPPAKNAGTPPAKNAGTPPAKNAPHRNTSKYKKQNICVGDGENGIADEKNSDGLNADIADEKNIADGRAFVAACATTPNTKSCLSENKKRFEAVAKVFNRVFADCEAVAKVSLATVPNPKTGRPEYTKTNQKRLKLMPYAWEFAKMRIDGWKDENGLIDGEKPNGRHILQWFEIYFGECLQDGFINGKGERYSHQTWRADFDYLLKAETLEKRVLEK